jgi:hypothetical protein
MKVANFALGSDRVDFRANIPERALSGVIAVHKVTPTYIIYSTQPVNAAILYRNSTQANLVREFPSFFVWFFPFPWPI